VLPNLYVFGCLSGGGGAGEGGSGGGDGAYGGGCTKKIRS